MRDVLASYHAGDIVVGIAEGRCDVLGPVKRRSHDDSFWVTIGDTIRSWECIRTKEVNLQEGNVRTEID